MNEDVGGWSLDNERLFNFVISCKNFGYILQSDIITALYKRFYWKEQDFIWARNANNSINPSLIRDIEELLTNSSYINIQKKYLTV